MLSQSVCEREISALHDLFVRWYCGRAHREEFERLERALGDTFEMVAPDGTVSDRETVLDSVRGRYDTRTGFNIEIRNVELVGRVDDHALVRYEEWQYPGKGRTDEPNSRRSTALFAPVDDPPGPESPTARPLARWQYLQETWLDAPDP